MPYNLSKSTRGFSAFSSARQVADASSNHINSRSDANAEVGRGGANATPNEVTEIERRVLAHERILQALICHLSGDDPEILLQLKARFGSGHNLGQYEQDFVSTDDYGDHFVRLIEREIDRLKRLDPASATKEK